MEEGIKNKIETMEIFKETADFFQFILKYKNCFSKKKYFTVDKNFKIIRKEPSFILELANIYYSRTENKDEEIERILEKEFSETYKEKEKRIDRMSKIEFSKLKDSYRRALINASAEHSVKLGNELMYRDKKVFFEIMYNFALVSCDCNKLIKAYFAEKMLNETDENENGSFSGNRIFRDEIIKDIINYFIKSNREFLDYENESDMKYFIENKADLLYKKIYTEKYDEIVKKYDIRNVRKINFEINEEKEYAELSESKRKLYDYFTKTTK